MASKKIKSSVSPLRPGETERIAAQLSRLLGEGNFESPEALDAYMQSLVGKVLPLPERESAEDASFELLMQARETPNAKRRAALARQALALDPDNADAFLLLAQDASTPAERMALIVDAVAAGERAIPDGIEAIAADGGVWGMHETRPYMRARCMLAMEQWMIGDRQPAIAELWELLRLNPNDNQGLRYLLLGWLLSAGSIAEVERLLAMHHDEGSASWLFDRALHAFRTLGDGAESRKVLKAAMRQNPYVAPMLLGIMPVPEILPDYVGFGDESEAAVYATEAVIRWSENLAAVEWMQTHYRKGARAGVRKR